MGQEVKWFQLWKPGYGRIIPAEWVWGVVDDINWLYIYTNLSHQRIDQLEDCIEYYFGIFNEYLRLIKEDTSVIRSKTEKIESKLQITNEYLRLITVGKGIKTLTKTVTTSPSPLYVDELTCRRIVVKVPSDALYLIYVGDSESQDFVLQKGEQIELFVKDPRQVYVKSTGEQKIWLLFELAQ